MFTFWKPKEELNTKEETLYEQVKNACDNFEKQRNFTMYDKTAIDIISTKIKLVSSQGIRTAYFDYGLAFPYHTNWDNVLSHFKKQGFTVKKVTTYKSDAGGYYSVFKGSISW